MFIQPNGTHFMPPVKKSNAFKHMFIQPNGTNFMQPVEKVMLSMQVLIEGLN